MNLIQKLQILYRANIKFERIKDHLSPHDRILDIGSGNGGLVYLLKNANFSVQALDVRNKSRFTHIQPQLYDGKKLPYKPDAFSVVTIITVLHHLADPIATLQEAVRVSSDRILIMEDIYENAIQKHLTFFADSLVNCEFEGHPHSNKTDQEWRKIFSDINLELEYLEFYRFAGVFRQVLYVLQKKKGMPE